MSSYAAVFGKNTCINNNHIAIKKALKEFHDTDEDIICVAIGPQHYAVVSSSGKASYPKLAGFEQEMKSIKRSNIKQIEFGTDNQWAIVMKNGFCHASLPPGPLAFVNKHQNKISYVALGIGVNDWVVGNGKNGYNAGSSTNSGLQGFLHGVNKSGGEIKLIQIGNNDQWIVQIAGKVVCNGTVPALLKNRLHDVSQPGVKTFALCGTLDNSKANCMSCVRLKRENQKLKNQLKVYNNNNNNNINNNNNNN
eukprot:226250_1